MIKKTVASIYKKIFHSSTIAIFNGLRKRTLTNTNENQTYQMQKLVCVLDVAFTNVEYYKKQSFNVKNFSYSDFIKIPVLTKEIIRTQSDRLINPHYNKMKQIYENTSGGSTGEPVTFYRTKEQARYGNANYFYALNQNGVDINGTSVDLWGAEQDMHNPNARFNIRSFIHNKETLNTFVLSDEIIKTYIRRLNAIKPKFIKAYVHSIYDMSVYINKHGLKIDFKPIIHCTTGPLYPEMREEIKKAFNQAYVYNFYGSREVSAIATEVKGQNGMHVLYDNVFIEILDEKNQPVKKGEEGEIVVTTLNNFYMPLLRYKIGDRAIKGDDNEFGTLKLETVVGRTLGVIHKNDGSKIDGQFFTTLFFGKKGIKNFQLVQKSMSQLELKIVKSESFKKEELDAVLDRIDKELINVNVRVIFCNKIDLTSTGKIMYVYSEL